MKRLCEYLFVSLGIAATIYFLNLVWMPFINDEIERHPGGVAVYVNFCVQIAIIVLPTVVSMTKFKLKAPFFSLVFLYLFCLIYEIQGHFLIFNTAPHAFLSYGVNYSKSESALYILILSGIVMLITTLFTVIAIRIIHYFNHRKKSKEIQSEDSNGL